MGLSIFCTQRSSEKHKIHIWVSNKKGKDIDSLEALLNKFLIFGFQRVWLLLRVTLRFQVGQWGRTVEGARSQWGQSPSLNSSMSQTQSPLALPHCPCAGFDSCLAVGWAELTHSIPHLAWGRRRKGLLDFFAGLWMQIAAEHLFWAQGRWQGCSGQRSREGWDTKGRSSIMFPETVSTALSCLVKLHWRH